MKTALQQLQYKVLFRSCNLPEKESLIRVGELNKVLNDIQELLEMEEEQIKCAFVAGDERGTKDIPFNADQYYSQTYK